MVLPSINNKESNRGLECSKILKLNVAIWPK